MRHECGLWGALGAALALLAPAVAMAFPVSYAATFAGSVERDGAPMDGTLAFTATSATCPSGMTRCLYGAMTYTITVGGTTRTQSVGDLLAPDPAQWIGALSPIVTLQLWLSGPEWDLAFERLPHVAPPTGILPFGARWMLTAPAGRESDAAFGLLTSFTWTAAGAPLQPPARVSEPPTLALGLWLLGAAFAGRGLALSVRGGSSILRGPARDGRVAQR